MPLTAVPEKSLEKPSRRRRRQRRGGGLVRVAVVAGLLAAAALSLAFRFGTEGMWWVEIARYVPFPAYLAPALVLLGFAWRLGWAWRLIAAIVPLLVVTEMMGLVVGSADTGGGRFRLMTYNVKSYLAVQHEDGFALLGWEIASQDADVILLQDAQIISSRPTVPEPIRAALAGRQTYVQGQYIVASRFPLKDCASGDMSYDGAVHDYVHCTLAIQGQEIDLFTAHFVSPRAGLNAARGKAHGGVNEWESNFADRLAQADKLTRGIAQARRPVIVAGDLNADEHSPVVRRLLATGLRDAFGSAGFGYGYTHGHSLRPGFSFLRIDHVLVSRGIGVRDCHTGGPEASEHRPVVTDLLIEPG